jgi:flavin-dependent dehydrogenase
MKADICVIGGGPAGAVAALELARFGFCVRLLYCPETRQQWPETVSPSLSTLLDRSGLGGVLGGAVSMRISEKWLLWQSTDPARIEQPHLVVVARSRLDAALREHAASAGVEVVAARAGPPVRGADGSWRVSIGNGTSIEADFIVIATGRRALMRGATLDGAPMTAYYGIARETPLPAGTMVIGSTHDVWYWCVALLDGSLPLTVFRSSRCANKTTPLALLRKALAHATTLCEPPLPQFIRGSDATARRSPRACGATWIRTGDALLTVDPLNGSGVYAAVLSSIQAARVVNTIIRRPGEAAAAIEFYEETLTNIAAHCASRTSDFYSAGMRENVIESPEAAPAVDQEDLFLAPGFRFDSIPALVGDYVRVCPGIKRTNKPSIIFIEGQPIGPLFAPLLAGRSLADAASSWSNLSFRGREHLTRLLRREGMLVSSNRHRRSSGCTLDSP